MSDIINIHNAAQANGWEQFEDVNASLAYRKGREVVAIRYVFKRAGFKIVGAKRVVGVKVAEYAEGGNDQRVAEILVWLAN